MNWKSRQARRSLVGAAFGIALLLSAWAILARSQPEIILPSPGETWDALLTLIKKGTLVEELGRTLGRAVTGVLIALVIGVIWGVLNGRSRWISDITHPWVSALMAIPPIVLVSLGLIWFGPGDSVTRMVIVLVALPLIVVTVEEAVRNIDQTLLEMAEVFQIRRSAILRQIIAPAIASPLLAAATVTFGQSIRVAIMAELLASTTGVGAQISQAQTNLDTAKIFAWTITIVVTVIALETLILRPITNRLLRWRNVPDVGHEEAAFVDVVVSE